MGNDALVDRLRRKGILRSDRVIAAFRSVDRADFVPASQAEHAYEDRPLPIGAGQTISAPHMVAVMTEALAPEEDDAVLEVGTGSGYQAAVLAELAGEVVTTEIVAELVEQARERLAAYDNVTVVETDGSTGYVEAAPYDGILYTAAAPDIAAGVLDQLAPGGTLVAPVGDRHRQDLTVYRKGEDGEIARDVRSSVRFVPLKGAAGQGQTR
ncbi:MAG: protein-L-isoaspartate(D-aspartate) O-methyltransferase [Candidatus Nanohaloarchaea archaeon]|nr:protein-L-isoaspartate(D-aspartate) O-methyltransferase [Candidatus Nanohaloarchaea archaeon]